MSTVLPAIQHARPQFTKRAENMFGTAKTYEARKICIVGPDEAPLYRGRNMECRCRPGGGRHYTRSKVNAMVERGEMEWVGRDRRVAMFTNPKTWAKVYSYADDGQVISCGMQLVSGGFF